jgi:hypothetical protein
MNSIRNVVANDLHGCFNVAKLSVATGHGQFQPLAFAHGLQGVLRPGRPLFKVPAASHPARDSGGLRSLIL